MSKISIIIRTYNEEKHIREVLESIENQQYKDYEVIIVDSESTDNTLNIVSQYNCKIVNILKKDFNYSYASNVGAKNASGEVLCYLSGHSVPLNKDYLTIINELFEDKNVGGVYGEVVALEDGSLTEKLFNGLGYLKSKILHHNQEDVFDDTSLHPGILSCSNAAILKSVWEEHPFAIELGKGGEDVEMAYYILKSNMKILKSNKAIVKHSHGSSFFKFIKEYKAWGKMYDDVLEYIDGRYK